MLEGGREGISPEQRPLGWGSRFSAYGHCREKGSHPAPPTAARLLRNAPVAHCCFLGLCRVPIRIPVRSLLFLPWLLLSQPSPLQQRFCCKCLEMTLADFTPFISSIKGRVLSTLSVLGTALDPRETEMNE